jgi:hypothetical protein
MTKKLYFIGLVVILLSLLIMPLGSKVVALEDQPPTEEEVKAAIAKGVSWIADQQDDSGNWIAYESCAVTALVVKKLEHHAVDPKWGLGLDSPFDETNPYKEHIEKGLHWLLENCAYSREISEQIAGDPDSDGDGFGIYFADMYYGSGIHHSSYTTGIALMALCEVVEFDKVVEAGPFAGLTLGDVARDTMDYLAWSQMDPNTGQSRGGWGYAYSDDGELFQYWDRSDNSSAGWVTLGLGFADTPPPAGCGFDIPGFVLDELDIWINFIQNDIDGDVLDGGSGYDHPEGWVNILKTGNLLQQMALVGDTLESVRVQDALDYMARHWNDENDDPGWRGWDWGMASYHATYTAMKGFTSFGLFHEFGNPPIAWQTDFETVLLDQQQEDGAWRLCNWGDDFLCTTWALLTLQKVAPPPSVPIDIKPQSCPNPLEVKKRGVTAVAILGTDDFDVSKIDPASVLLEGIAPLRWAWEDIATPFEPYLGKMDAYDCNEYGPDGYYDLTLKFKSQELITALGEVHDGEVLVLQLTGNLKEEFGGGYFVGEDVIWILDK